MSKNYRFDRNFQVKILTVMVLDPMMLKNYRDVLSPTYFEAEEMSILSRLVLDYFDRYTLMADRETLESLLQEYARNARIDDSMRRTLLDLVIEVYSNSLQHSKYVLDQIIPFGRRQKIKKAYLDTSALIDDLEKNETSIWRTISEAFRSGVGSDSERADFMTSWQTLPQRYQEFHESDATGRIPTGILKVDQSLDGGLGMFEVGMIEALPGIGKSRMLVNIGAVSVINRKNVLFITNELHTLDIELMFASRLSGLPQKSLRDPANAANYVHLMEQVLQVDSFLEVVYYPPFRMDISTLRALVSKTENIRGQKVDMVIIDMFDRLGGIDPKNPWNSQYFLLKELMAVTADFNTRIWTTTHVKSSGYATQETGEMLGMGHSGGSVAKPQDIDIMLSLNQSPKQEEDNIAYIGLPKIRRSAGQRKVKVYFDKSRSLLLDWDQYFQMQLNNTTAK